jgi:hypothetical protein|tara:strand:- start:463 stop:702 length:240 start_codon:yes stop_codon:yes gene_type:complete
LKLTPALLLSDFYYDLHDRRSEVKQQIKAGSDGRDKLEETLSVLEDILEIRSSLGSWQDEVETALNEGRMPDWTKGASD